MSVKLIKLSDSSEVRKILVVNAQTGGALVSEPLGIISCLIFAIVMKAP